MIDIDEVTLKQLREIALLIGRPRKKKCRISEKPVIVRSYGAGVFFGYLVAKRGNEVDLVRCRRIWGWKGANTCSEIALHGVAQGSKIAETTPLHTVFDVIEIIEAQPEAVKILENSKWD